MSNLGSSAADTDRLPISLVAHTVFCPRRAWLEAVGEKVDSAQMLVGTNAHRRVDDPGASQGGDRRAVDVWHDGLGLVGRCDLVRGDGDEVQVVEYKAAPVRRRAEVTAAQRVQLMLQRECLTEMGYRIGGISVYFTNHHTHVEVPVDDAAIAEARAAVELTRAVVAGDHAPLPLVDDPRCSRCSHVGICLPDERGGHGSVRRISVADPDGEILHLITPGSRVSLNRGRLRVVKGEEELGTLPLERVRGLVVHGNVDISGALLRELMWRNLTIVWCSGRGRVIGWSRSAEAPNGQARVRQHAVSDQGFLPLAREFVSAKINNQATQLRRNAGSLPPDTIARLREAQRAALVCGSLPDLFAVEGGAAAAYFRHLPAMLRVGPGDDFVSRWPGRTGRAANDPLNAALNYAYGLLLSDTVRAIVACGLDPSAGFLHSSGRNKPALALDLMEEFRTPVAESAVIGAINNGELKMSMFTTNLGDARLRDRGRRALTDAFERRVQGEFRHPTFGYQVSWRRAMEIQARMVLGVLDGTQERYVGVRVR